MRLHLLLVALMALVVRGRDHVIFSSNRGGAGYRLYRVPLASQPATTTRGTAADPLTVSHASASGILYFDDMNAKTSPDGAVAVFYSNRTGSQDIWRLDLANLSATPLTTGSSSEYDPSFSADGRRVYYKSNQHDGHGDIWAMAADGSGPQNLTPNRPDTEDWAPVEAPDGSMLFFTSRPANAGAGGDEVWAMGTDGSSQRALTAGGATVPNWYSVVSPLAPNTLLYIHNPAVGAEDEVWQMTVPPSGSTTAGSQVSIAAADPAWSPDATAFAFLRLVPGAAGGRFYQLFWRPVAGAESDLRVVEPTVPDDGSQVLGPWWYTANGSDSTGSGSLPGAMGPASPTPPLETKTGCTGTCITFSIVAAVAGVFVLVACVVLVAGSCRKPPADPEAEPKA